MNELGLVAPFWVIVLIWLAKVVLLTFVSVLLAWLGVLTLDALTPNISHRERIGEDPRAVGIFVAGFFIFMGLVIHGAISALTAVTSPIVWYVFDFRTWAFMSINRSPVAAGVHVFGYLVFFGLVLHAALTGPL